MDGSQPSNEAKQALKTAQEALNVSKAQANDIAVATKLGYQAINKIETHEQICALRAEQTLAKVAGIDAKLDKLISVLLSGAKITTTTVATGAVALIVWLIQTNGAG